MSPSAEVLDLALRLSPEDRAAIAARLLLSLEPDVEEEDHEAAWAAEIRARLERVDRGEYTATEWREALERIRTSLRRTPAP